MAVAVVSWIGSGNRSCEVVGDPVRVVVAEDGYLVREALVGLLSS